MLKDRVFLYIALFVCLSGILVCYAVPLVLSVYETFTVETIAGETTADGSGITFTLDKYKAVLSNESFRLALKNTLIFTLLAVLVLNVLPFAIAGLLFRSAKNRVFLYIFILPMAVPVIATTSVWKDILDGMSVSFTYGNKALISMLVLLFWKYAGFHTLIYLSGMNSIPRSELEAAALDGAGAITRAIRIMLPEMTSFIVFNLLFSVVHSFAIFRDIYMIFGNYPPESVYLLQHFIQNNFVKLNYDNVLTAAYIFFIIIFAVIVPLIIKERREERAHD